MLDLRWPIGLFFCINAAVLITTGIVQPVATQIADLSVNLNLSWGMVMAAFGIFMLAFSFLDKKAKQK